MIGTRDHQLRIGETLRDLRKGLNENFRTLVSPPLAERENAMLGIAAPADVGKLRSSREDAMFPQMHIFAAILLEQHLAVGGQ